MRIVGWCEKCRRIRPVRVTNAEATRALSRGRRVAVGTCTQCEDAEDQERRQREKNRRDLRGYRTHGHHP